MKKNPSRNVHFSKGPSEILDAIKSSIDIDQRMYKEYITGSIAHAKMIGKQKIINKKQQKLIFNKLKYLPNNTQISIGLIKNVQVNYYGVKRQNDSISTVNNSKNIFLWAPGQNKKKIIKNIIKDKKRTYPASYLKSKNNFLFHSN